MAKFEKCKYINLPLWVLLALSGTLFFVYTLPHAMALRKFLLATAFLISAKAFLTALRQQKSELVFVLTVYAVLQVWMFVVALFIANPSMPSLLEWKGQWLTTTLSFIIGMGLAAMLMGANLRNPVSVVALTVAIPAALVIAMNSATALHVVLDKGSFIIHDANRLQIGNVGFVMALLMPLLIADILNRIARQSPLFPFSVWLSSIILGIAVFALLSTSRNGLLTLLLAFILGGAMVLSELRKIYSPKRIAAISLICSIFMAGYVGLILKSDTRWQNFAETIPIAWDVDRDTRWLDGAGNDLPLTPSGMPVEESEYYRIAWAHEAWRRLLEHPWGTEISRDTFKRLEVEKYGHAGMAHSHNSWLDFGLNFGFPGLMLWATFLFLLARTGWRAWQAHREPLGFALVLLVVLFAFRALFDACFRNHVIEQFMLVAGLLLGAITFGKKQPTST